MTPAEPAVATPMLPPGAAAPPVPPAPPAAPDDGPPGSTPSSVPTLLLLAVTLPLVAFSPWTLSLGLVLLCGVYVAFEFALVKVSTRALQGDARRGVRGASMLLGMKRDMNAMLAACQFGITLTSLGLTLALEPAIHHALTKHAGGALVRAGAWIEPHALSAGLAMICGSLFHVTFGELVPKGLALISPLAVLYRTAPFLRLFRRLAVPFIATCNGLANVVVRGLTGKDPSKDVDHEEGIDLREALLHASTSGQIAPAQLALMRNVLTFAQRSGREVMTPARSVVSVGLHAEWDEVKRVMEESRFSRYPVVDEQDGGRITGYVRHLDVLRAEARGERTLRPLVRSIERRPETVPISKLNLFQGSPLVALYDEHDTFVGLLSAEDVVEEIVGEIYDETDDRAAQRIQRLGGGKVRVPGSMLLDQAAEALGLREEVVDDADVDTIGGLVLKRLGRQPSVGDDVPMGPLRAIVEEASGFRITRLRFEPLDTLEK